LCKQIVEVGELLSQRAAVAGILADLIELEHHSADNDRIDTAVFKGTQILVLFSCPSRLQIRRWNCSGASAIASSLDNVGDS